MPNPITGSGNAPAAPFPFDVAGARAAGYTDGQIVDELSKSGKVPFDFAGALKAGHSPSDILQEVAPQPSGLIDNARQGTADVLSGVGKTIETHLGKGDVGTTLQNWGKAAAPTNFVPTPLVDAKGFHASGILPTLARTAPEAAGAIIAAGMAPEALGAAGPVAAGAGAYALMNAGNAAQQAAATRTGKPNATPSTGDLVRGDLTAAASGAVSALPVGRFLLGSDPIAATGVKGVAAALRKLGVTTGEQAAASGASNVVDQVGQSVGTPKGVNVDPTQVANSVATGALTGAVAGARPAAREALDVAKYRNVTPDLQPAATQFANRMQQAADGANLNAGVISGGSAFRAGADAFGKASDAVRGELKDAVADLKSRTVLPTDANNVLNAAMSGKQPSDSDYAMLRDAIKGDPQGANVINLVRQAHVANIVKGSGSLSHDKFVGGLSSLPTLLNAHTAEKSGLAALMTGAAIEGGAGHLITYSPEAMAALAGIAGAARIADKLTGARSPAGRFVRNFADGNTPVREAVPAPQPSPRAAVGPTGPSIPLPPRPWGNGAPSNAVSTPPVAGASGSIITPQVRASMNARATLAKLAASQVAAPKQTPTSINPLALPASIKTPAVNIMRGLAMVQKLRDKAAAPAAATAPAAIPASVVSQARGAALANTLQPLPAAVSKANGVSTVSMGNGKSNVRLPLAPHAHLPAPEAAQHILADRLASYAGFWVTRLIRRRGEPAFQ